MDYSLLVGIHDIERAEQELNDSVESEENGFDEDEEDEDSPGTANAGSVPTPPDSPMAMFMSQPSFTGEIDPIIERFAMKSSEREYLSEGHFCSLFLLMFPEQA